MTRGEGWPHHDFDDICCELTGENNRFNYNMLEDKGGFLSTPDRKKKIKEAMALTGGRDLHYNKADGWRRRGFLMRTEG